MSDASVAASPREETNRTAPWPGADSSYFTSKSTPTFTVWVTENQVHGYNWPEEALVTLTIDDPDTPAAVDYDDSQTVGPAPWDPNQMVVIFDFEGAFDVEPGHIVTLLHSPDVQSHTVTNLALTEVNPDTDTVSGTAEPFTGVYVDVCDENGCLWRNEQADESGDWTADFSTFGDEPDEENTYDIGPGSQGNAYQHDGDGDATGIPWRVPNPYFDVFAVDDQVQGWEWPEGALVTLLIDDPGIPGTVNYSESETVGPAPWDPEQTWVLFDFGASFDVEPGHTVTLTDGDTAKNHTVTNLAVTGVDPDTDTVSGTAQPGAEVHVWVHGDPACQVVVDPAGDWTADCGVVGSDIVPGTAGRARQHDEDGDGTAVDWRLPNPVFWVSPFDERVDGTDWPLGALVTLLIDDPDIPGTVNYSESQTVVVAPWDPNQTSVSFEFAGSFDVEPGHIVTLTDGDTAKNHTVTNLAVTGVDPDTDTVSGTAEAGTDIQIHVCDETGCVFRHEVAGGTGDWSADFSVSGDEPGEEDTYDIGPGSGGEANQWDDDGDGTHVHWRVPNPTFNVWLTRNQVHGYDWPLGAEVCLSIADYSDCQTVGPAPWDSGQTFVNFELQDAFEVQPGHFVTLSDGVTTKSHTVTNLALTDVDPDADTVSGTAEPGSEVSVNICDETGCVTSSEVADGGGDWTADFSLLGYDIVPGTQGEAYQHDDDGDGTAVDWRVPNPRFTAWLTDGRVDGYEWPDGAEVCLSIDDLDPAVSPDHFECRTAGYVPWHSGETWVGFDLRGVFHVQPGYTVTMADGVTTKTHTVTDVAVTAVDPAADTVSGTAAPGSEVWVDAWGPGGASRHEVAGGEGNWTADFSTPGDEPNEGGTFDIVSGSQGKAGQYDDDSDETGVIWTPGGTISGTVTDTGASPIGGAWVEACPFTDGGRCSGGWTAADGTYTTGLVAAGDHRVQARAAGYVCEYYDDTVDWGAATAVAVTEGNDTPGIDFGLAIEGTISGAVTDPGGTPIAGAWVSADAYSGYGSYGYATTGPDGTYTIGGLATGDYRVQACAEGYACEYYDDTLDWSAATAVAVAEGNDTPGIDFSLRVEGTISGSVTGPGGSPIGGASVWACPFTGSGFCQSASTASDGTYTIGGLATGDYRVQACAEGHACEYYDDTVDWNATTPVPVTEGEDTPGIDFALAIEGTISGAVTDTGASPIDGAWVEACLFTGSGFCQSASTAPDGTYTIGALATGDYRVQACAEGYACEYYDDTVDWNAATLVAVTEGDDTPGIDFGLAIEGTISGTVTGPGGSPIDSASVWACPFTGSGFCQSASTASDGTYTIGGLPTGDYRVQACAEGHACEYYDDTVDWSAATAVPVTEGDDTPGIDFALAVEGTISGTVTGPGGIKIGGASLWACPFTGSGFCQSASTASDGTYTISRLATGDYRVQACAEDYACAYYDDTVDWNAATPVPVTEGQDTSKIDFNLRVEGTISGTVSHTGGSPIGGAWVEACPFTGSGFCQSASTAPDGTYTIGRLGTGDYRVQACAPGYVCEYYDDHVAYGDADPVAVTEGADTPGIDFGLAIEGTISGTVTGPGGSPIGGASLWACRFTGGGSCSWGSTAPDGTYTIGGLATGDYSVQACAPGYVCEYYDDHVAYGDADPVAVTEGVDTPGIDFGLAIEGTISGMVTDPGGTPIAGASVSADAYSGYGSYSSATTGPDGTYTIGGLATGDYRVQACAEGYACEYYDDTLDWNAATPVPVTQGEDTPGIDFTLSVEGTISGVVTDAFGEPIGGAMVSAHVDPYVGGFWQSASTAPDGTYTIAGLPSGFYYVAAGPQPFAESPYVREFYYGVRWPDEATPVEVVEGGDSGDIDFSLEIGGSISGTVTDAGGTPIAGARVHLEPCDHQPPWWWDILYSPETASDGSYTVSNLATGSYIVWAEADSYATEYYDDTPNYDDATPVSVVEGSDTPNIDFSLSMPDSDGDGCADVEEWPPVPDDGLEPRLPAETGGFDPNAWYDFFDVPVPTNPDPTPNGTKDQAIAMADVLAVLFYVPTWPTGVCGDNPNANGVDYDCVKGSCDWNHDTVPDKEGICYDRAPGPEPSPPWDAGPPDDAVAMADVLAVLAQVILDCRYPP